MDDLLFLRNLGLMFIAAGLVAFLGRFVRVPSIVSYIIAGLILGPALGLVEVDYAMEVLAEFGIALLLFLVGLELSFDKIRDVGKVAIVAGIGQVIFTATGGYLLCWALGFGPMDSLFLAVGLTFSSTVVVVKLLDQLGDLNRLYGRIAVGIFLVQDLVVVLILTLLAGVAHGGDESSLTFAALATGVLKAFGGLALICLAVLGASKYLLPKPFAWAARSSDVIFLWALCWCFLVVLGAEELGLSLEIGAFLAGIGLAQMPYNDDLRRRVHPVMNFFVAVFFISLGLQMEFAEAAAAWPTSMVLSLFVLIGNPLIFMFIITRMGYGERTAFKTSVTVAQISEFSFIFAAMGVATGLVGTQILSITALVGIVTIVVSSYMILESEWLYAIFRRTGILKIFRAPPTDPSEDNGSSRAGHVIVVGMSPFGQNIVRSLCDRGLQVLAIDTDPGKLLGLPCETMIGNIEYASVLEEAGLDKARLAISALQIEDTNQMLAYRCKEAQVPCAIHAFDPSVVDDLLELEVDYLMMPKIDSILEQRDRLKKEGVL